MTNKYLEKLAGVGLHGNKLTEHKMAEKYGKTPIPKSEWEYLQADHKSGMRASGRGIITAGAMGLAGHDLAAMLANRTLKRGKTTPHRARVFSRGIGAGAAAIGYGMGIAKSFSNQNKEIENKYKPKKS